MDDILKQSYVLPTGDPMPVLGLGTWQLVGSACTRIVRKALDESGIEARLVDAVYT